MAKKPIRPEPVPQTVVCSVCGLDWHLHAQDDDAVVDYEDCIRVLKAELARRPVWRSTYQGIGQTYIPANANYNTGVGLTPPNNG